MRWRPSSVDWAALTDGLGDTWELQKNTYKPYPAGIVVHPVIDAALALRQAHAIAPDDNRPRLWFAAIRCSPRGPIALT